MLVHYTVFYSENTSIRLDCTETFAEASVINAFCQEQTICQEVTGIKVKDLGVLFGVSFVIIQYHSHSSTLDKSLQDIFGHEEELVQELTLLLISTKIQDFVIASD